MLCGLLVKNIYYYDLKRSDRSLWSIYTEIITKKPMKFFFPQQTNKYHIYMQANVGNLWCNSALQGENTHTRTHFQVNINHMPKKAPEDLLKEVRFG